MFGLSRGEDMTRIRGQANRNHTRRVIRRKRIRSMLMIVMVVICLVVVSGVLKLSLKHKEAAYIKQSHRLEEQIKQEQARSEELDDLEEYMASDQYVEEVAMEKLGLAYPNDILLKTK